MQKGHLMPFLAWENHKQRKTATSGATAGNYKKEIFSSRESNPERGSGCLHLHVSDIVSDNHKAIAVIMSIRLQQTTCTQLQAGYA